ncbi:hypothetical protein DERP_006583 [Dermatophagoides pteronyssinus]|uniref:Uncharacterized protein n=1 Tax=Dermatophagoides pteronyssinus TaxID=6956 RepID=A0ABQ8IR92_DERPT|nr:hypothetical protein DERP_006583 [Dermatophagoides pteronyssinus]
MLRKKNYERFPIRFSSLSLAFAPHNRQMNDLLTMFKNVIMLEFALQHEAFFEGIQFNTFVAIR